MTGKDYLKQLTKDGTKVIFTAGDVIEAFEAGKELGPETDEEIENHILGVYFDHIKPFIEKRRKRKVVL